MAPSVMRSMDDGESPSTWNDRYNVFVYSTYLGVMAVSLGVFGWLICLCCGGRNSDHDENDDYPSDCPQCAERGDYCDDCWRELSENERNRRRTRNKKDRRKKRKRSGGKGKGRRGSKNRRSADKRGGRRGDGGGRRSRSRSRSAKPSPAMDFPPKPGGGSRKFDPDKPRSQPRSQPRSPMDGREKVATDDVAYQTLRDLNSGIFELDPKEETGDRKPSPKKLAIGGPFGGAAQSKGPAGNLKSTGTSRPDLSDAYHLLGKKTRKM